MPVSEIETLSALVIDRDTQDILTLFEKHDNYACYSLVCDACILGSYFANFSVQYIWKEENIYTDYVVSEGTRVQMRIVQESGFF